MYSVVKGQSQGCKWKCCNRKVGWVDGWPSSWAQMKGSLIFLHLKHTDWILEFNENQLNVFCVQIALYILYFIFCVEKIYQCIRAFKKLLYLFWNARYISKLFKTFANLYLFGGFNFPFGHLWKKQFNSQINFYMDYENVRNNFCFYFRNDFYVNFWNSILKARFCQAANWIIVQCQFITSAILFIIKI